MIGNANALGIFENTKPVLKAKPQLILETKRLRLEEAVLSDGPFFWKLLNSPKWKAYIGDRKINAKSDAETYIQKELISNYKKQGFGLWKVVLKESNEPIGICGFVKRNYLNHPDIGFATLPKYEGNGYTYEAADACLMHGKDTLGFDLVQGITTPNNVASQQLLKKLGLKQQKDTHTINGTELLVFSE